MTSIPVTSGATQAPTPSSGPRWLHCYQGDRGFHLARYQDGSTLLLTGMHFVVDGSLTIMRSGTRHYSGTVGTLNPTLLDQGLALCVGGATPTPPVADPDTRAVAVAVQHKLQQGYTQEQVSRWLQGLACEEGSNA